MNFTIKQSDSFKKAIKKLPKQQKAILDEEIKKLIQNPTLGERKKGDLDFLRGDPSPKNKTMTKMRNPLKLLQWRTQNEKTLQRRADYQSNQRA